MWLMIIISLLQSLTQVVTAQLSELVFSGYLTQCIDLWADILFNDYFIIFLIDDSRWLSFLFPALCYFYCQFQDSKVISWLFLFKYFIIMNNLLSNSFSDCKWRKLFLKLLHKNKNNKHFAGVSRNVSQIRGEPLDW